MDILKPQKKRVRPVKLSNIPDQEMVQYPVLGYIKETPNTGCRFIFTGT